MNSKFIDRKSVVVELMVMKERHSLTQSPDVFELPMHTSEHAIGLLFSGALRKIELVVLIQGEDESDLKSKKDTLETFCSGGANDERSNFSYVNWLNETYNVIVEEINYTYEVTESGVINLHVNIDLVEAGL